MIPETATTKLAALVQQAEDARALAHAAKARTEVLEAKVVQLHNAHGSETEIATTIDERERALELQQSRYRAWQDQEQLLAQVQSWLRELPRASVLEAVAAPPVSMNGTAVTVIGGLRTRITKLASEHHTVRTADAPLDDAKQQARDLVARLGAKGRPRITTQFGTLDVYGWDNPQAQFGPTPHSVTVNFLCWAVPDQMIARLDEALEGLPTTGKPDALPLAERAAKLAELEARIFDLELEEEQVISAAAEDNITIPRRYEQSPPSILGVRVTSATARAAAKTDHQSVISLAAHRA